MLAFVAEGLRPGTAKKLRFLPGALLHIDESAAISGAGNDEEAVTGATRRQLVEALRRNSRQIFVGAKKDDDDDDVGGMYRRDSVDERVPPLHMLPLEKAMSIEEGKAEETVLPWAVDVSGPSGMDDYQSLLNAEPTRNDRLRLKAFLGKLKTTTSKIRAVQLLRRKLIAHVAHRFG